MSISTSEYDYFFEIKVLPDFEKIHSVYRRKIENGRRIQRQISEDLERKKIENKQIIIGYDYFDIDKKQNDKIQKLLKEINSLPKNQIREYTNLITHQLRTIFAISLISYWDLNGKKFPKQERRGLKNIIDYTINNAIAERLPEAQRIVDELKEIKISKIKELADDVAHCNYTLSKSEDTELFCKHIKHILSLIYGR
jgi:hypothetical protein